MAVRELEVDLEDNALMDSEAVAVVDFETDALLLGDSDPEIQALSIDETEGETDTDAETNGDLEADGDCDEEADSLLIGAVVLEKVPDTLPHLLIACETDMVSVGLGVFKPPTVLVTVGDALPEGTAFVVRDTEKVCVTDTVFVGKTVVLDDTDDVDDADGSSETEADKDCEFDADTERVIPVVPVPIVVLDTTAEAVMVTERVLETVTDTVEDRVRVSVAGGEKVGSKSVRVTLELPVDDGEELSKAELDGERLTTAVAVDVLNPEKEVVSLTVTVGVMGGACVTVFGTDAV